MATLTIHREASACQATVDTVTDMTDGTPDTETDAIVAELEKAGLIETTVREDGRTAYTLTAQGERVARQMAMAGDEKGVLLDVLLGE